MIISEVNYHKCISRIVTADGKSGELSLMLPHSSGEKPAFSILFPTCGLALVACEHCTLLAASMHYRKGFGLQLRQP